MEDLTAILAQPMLKWIPALTLIYLLASQPWRINMSFGTTTQTLGVLLVVVAASGLFVPALAASATYWFLMAAIHFTWLFQSSHVADNHHFLIGYWVVAISIALAEGGVAGEATLGASSRLLIGLCFLTAALAKLASRSYRDSSFFTWELLADPRFLPLLAIVGGHERDDIQRHAVARLKVRSGMSSRETAPVRSGVRRLALMLTWWTVFIELAIAILFLVPIASLEIVRVGALAIFVVTTFAFVSVAPFGQVLLIILLAGTSDVALRYYCLMLAAGLGLLSCVPQVARRLLQFKRTSPVPAYARTAQNL